MFIVHCNASFLFYIFLKFIYEIYYRQTERSRKDKELR